MKFDDIKTQINAVNEEEVSDDNFYIYFDQTIAEINNYLSLNLPFTSDVRKNNGIEADGDIEEVEYPNYKYTEGEPASQVIYNMSELAIRTAIFTWFRKLVSDKDDNPESAAIAEMQFQAGIQAMLKETERMPAEFIGEDLSADGKGED